MFNSSIISLFVRELSINCHHTELEGAKRL